jgi:hypothetical protein
MLFQWDILGATLVNFFYHFYWMDLDETFREGGGGVEVFFFWRETGLVTSFWRENVKNAFFHIFSEVA